MLVLIRRPDIGSIPEDSMYRPRAIALLSSGAVAAVGLALFALGFWWVAMVAAAVMFVMLFASHKPLETKGFSESEEWLIRNWDSLSSDSRAQALVELRKRFGVRYRRMLNLEARLSQRQT